MTMGVILVTAPRTLVETVYWCMQYHGNNKDIELHHIEELKGIAVMGISLQVISHIDG